MTAPVVAVCSRSFARDPVLRGELEARCGTVRYPPEGVALRGEALVAFLDGVDQAIVSLQRIDDALLDRLPRLRRVSKFGVGLDTIDQEALARRGLVLGWQGGVNRRAVAELVISHAIALLREVPAVHHALRGGRWTTGVRGRELGSVRLGVVGCGHIGKEVLRLARAFGTRCAAHDLLVFPAFYREHGVEPLGLEELLQSCDVVSLHVPLDATTQGLLSAERLALLRPGAVLINTARGHLIDQDALAQGVVDGRIGGAALDVFDEEPCVDHRLHGLPNVILTPHIAGTSVQGVRAMGRAAIAGLELP